MMNGATVENNQENQPKITAESIVTLLAELSRAVNAHAGAIERLTWLTAQGYAGDYLSSLDPRLIIPQDDLQTKLNEIVSLVKKFVYTGDYSALERVAEETTQERKASKLIVPT